MKSIAIFYFSGTGNTEIIAKMIKEQFMQNQYTVDFIKIEDVLKAELKIDVGKYEMIGIGSQVIGYSIPSLVRKFIKRLPRENNKKVFIFRTAGGVAPINYNASKSAIRLLSKRGYDVFYERLFSIGSNWVRKFDDEIVIQLYEASKRKVALMCQQLIRGEKRIYKTTLKLRVIMGVMETAGSMFFRLVGKDFVVDKSCTNCGFCIKNCPAQNIYEKNKKIMFRMSCNSCMRCVYSCPKKAINLKFFKFFPVPGGYNINKTLESPSPSNDIANRYTPGFLNDYIKNDEI